MAYRFGIDAGSKTVKVVIMDESGDIVHSIYRRHLSDIRTTLTDVLHNLAWRYGDLQGQAAVTGSAGIALADMLGLPFVQEVVATTRAVKDVYPQADAVIELGGEDAKVMYLSGNLEQRMNASCAGGTGGFIDTIAFMLGVRSGDMSRLAGGASRTYPIASRCAVFAQTDVRPLLNAGVSKSDIAASALEAVVRQTIGGLACGRPITGTVVFLGGPLEYVPDLVRRFRMALGLSREECIKPRYAHTFTARGAALFAGDALENPVVGLADLERRIKEAPEPEDDLSRLAPLFGSAEEREAFLQRHREQGFPRKRLFDCEGPLYLGIDAGSTTVKMAVIDGDDNLVYSDYQPVGGDSFSVAAEMLGDFYRALPRTYGSNESLAWVAHATATGYGEDLLRCGLGVDSGVVETTAHVRAAQELDPQVSFVLDIGGQDMKALWVRDGYVTNAVLNEACSSGCGSFIEGTAHSLKVSRSDFDEAALEAESPVDLGTKCTVFMTSRVRHAQKIGAGVPDLAAGIAYSVVRNALFRIIGAERVDTLGNHIVVQGGAFKSNAVLRAFEQTCGVQVTRPDTAHLMGAIGAAIVARDRAQDSQGNETAAKAAEEGSAREGATADAGASGARSSCRSTLVGPDELDGIALTRRTERCPGCTNACLVTIADFGGGRQMISGNRCEKAALFLARDGEEGANGAKEGRATHDRIAADETCKRDDAASASITPPNSIALQQRELARFRSAAATGARGGVAIGLMTTFESYEHTPFWHTLLSRLGFSVVMPDDRRGSAFESEAAATVPAESVCYPAKMAHARLHDLMHAGARVIFMPRYTRGGRCSVACEYVDALIDSVPAFAAGELTMCAPTLLSLRPAKIAQKPDDCAAVWEALRQVAPGEAPLSREEFDAALSEAAQEQQCFTDAMERANEAALAWTHENPARRGIVLTGRPYHADPRLMRGVDVQLSRLGFAVLTTAGLSKYAKRVPHTGNESVPPWKPGKHLTRMARFVVSEPQLELICLQSFGCGYDAVSLEDVRDMLEAAGRPFTALKIDDIADMAHIRIRLRTLAEAIEARGRRAKAGKARPAQPQPGGTANRATNCTPAKSVHSKREAWLLEDGGVNEVDAEVARREVPNDVCFTAAALMARAIRLTRENPALETLHVPNVCERCLLDALPHTVERVCGHCPEVAFENVWRSEDGDESADATSPAASPKPVPDAPQASPDPQPRPRIGILGNPLLCYDAFMNDGIADTLRALGCEPVLPEAENLFTEDVSYLPQLDAFQAANVQHVIYLESFGCLKAHVHARGFLHELSRRYPTLPITAIDHDPESSSLNRENRVRLAVEAAERALRQSPEA